MNKISYSVGESVRVKSKDLLTSRISIIAINNEDNTYDLDDEDNVHFDRLNNFLEEFELNNNNFDYNPLQLKNQGNILFKKLDYIAAINKYKQSLNKLNKLLPLLSVGSSVLVSGKEKENQTLFRSGIISDNDDGKYEIMYDDDEEEYEVDIARLNQVAPKSIKFVNDDDNNNNNKIELGIDIQRALYMNLARCYLKRNQTGWSVYWSSLAIALILSNIDEDNIEDSNNIRKKKEISDAYLLRCKSLLTSRKPGLAKKDCKELIKYDSIKGEALMKEIKLFTLKKSKSDRVLARNIGAWVKEAFEIQENLNTNNNNDNDDDDLQINGYDDVDDDDNNVDIIENNKDIVEDVNNNSENKEECIIS